MKIYGGVEVWLHSCLTSTPDLGQQSVSFSGRIAAQQETMLPAEP